MGLIKVKKEQKAVLTLIYLKLQIQQDDRKAVYLWSVEIGPSHLTYTMMMAEDERYIGECVARREISPVSAIVSHRSSRRLPR